MTVKINCVDFFCGAGGLTHGLRRAGVKVRAGVDFEASCRYAYEFNNKPAVFLHRDITKIQPEEIAHFLPKQELSMLVGCAPCQAFSTLNVNQSDKSDHRRALMDYFIKFVVDLRPDFVISENVHGAQQAPAFRRLLRTLGAQGYHVDWCIVNCADYGVPQSRERLILLAHHQRIHTQELPLGIPNKTVSEHVTVRQAIGDLPTLKRGELFNNMHFVSDMSDSVYERLKHIPHDGGDFQAIPKELMSARYGKPSLITFKPYSRLWWDKPAKTITTHFGHPGANRCIHPEQNRTITLREAARFQSFPDSFQFFPSHLERAPMRETAKMIGNAVPPLLAYELGRAVVKYAKKLE